MVQETAQGPLEVFVSPDKTQAFFRVLYPKDEWGAVVTSQEISRVLTVHGIQVGVCNNLIEKSLDEVQKTGIPKKNVLVADARENGEQNPPCLFLGDDAKPLYLTDETMREEREFFECLKRTRKRFDFANWEEGEGLMGYWVREGETIGKNPEAGSGTLDVYGRPVESRKEKPVSLLKAGDHVACNERDGTFQAEVSGYLSLESYCLSVVQPLVVNENKTEVHLVTLPYIKRGHGLSPGDVQELLKGLGVEREAWVRFEMEDLTSGNGARILIAAGKEPEKGRDAFFTLRAVSASSSDSAVETEAIDYREQTHIVNMTRGEIIAEKAEATSGTPGWDVFGEPIPNTDGKDFPVTVGKNIEVRSEDGITSYLASEDGILEWDGQTLSLEPALVISGDLDYSVGNIDTNTPVVVLGTVQSGFRVVSMRSVLVEGHVNNGAYVSSAQSVTVKKGVFGKETRIWAKGDVTLSFIQEAKVVTPKRIFVEKFSLNATLLSGDGTEIRGRGLHNKSALIGGLANGKNFLDVRSAGSASAGTTRVVAGVDLQSKEEVDSLKKHLEVLHLTILKFNRGLGFRVDSPKAAAYINQMPPDRKVKMVERLREIKLTLSREKLIKHKMEKLQESAAKPNPDARIKVRGELVPDVQVQIVDSRKNYTEHATKIEFFLNSEGEVEALLKL